MIKLICGDCLDIIPELEPVDLIYIDPPFGRNSTDKQFGCKWIDMNDYISWLELRVIVCKDILKPTGSFYIHCDWHANHHIRLMLDNIFGARNFRNEIIWCYRGGGVPKNDFANRHDIILRYSKGDNYIFNLDDIRTPYSDDSLERLQYEARSFRKNKVYEGYRPNPLGKYPDDWWELQPIAPSSKERTGYPTQKPLALLERIIKASSNKGDVIFDPMCGSGTTLVAADRLNRNSIGIDINKEAIDICKKRLNE